ncbi:MAG: adenylyl-sulfate kinase [Candidatus Nealsonbacteria bacterium]
MDKSQKGFVLWFTGLPQSGKSTIADRIYQALKEKGLELERLDGDIVRQSFTKDLGFSKEDRDENIRRVGFLSKILSKHGVGVIASFIAPYKAQREGVRKEAENFVEVYCKCPLEVCEKRDTRGFYKKARNGEIENFTGVSDPYEEPENPEITVETDKENIEQCIEKIINFLKKTGYINE